MNIPATLRPERRPLEHFTGRALLGLLAVTGAGVGFGVLLLLVRVSWDPLYDVDHGIAAWLNAQVSAHGPIVTALEAISRLGGRPVMIWLVAAAVVGLLIRRQPRLAIFLVAAGVGALFLDPSLKLLVGRLRPVVEAPVASAPGNSFPSGHALGVTVVYGALLLVFLPVIRPRLRPVAIAVVATIIFLVGASRVGLGVHFLSDVLAGWLLGLAWLGVTAHAFRVWRRELHRPVPPITEGLEPEAAHDIAPAADERKVLPHPLVKTAEILTGWVLVFGLLYLVGTLVTRYADGTIVRSVDLAVAYWFAEHRTDALNDVSYVLSKAGDTHAILLVSLTVCPLLVAILRRWRPVLFIAMALIGEVTLFLASSAAVDRPRPPVPHLDGNLPTSSFPSGHIAATICLYAAIAILVMPRTTAWWRWLTVALAVIMPLLVASSRMYRGMHHVTDLLGAITLSALWLGLLWWVIRPNADVGQRAAPEDAEERTLAAARR